MAGFFISLTSWPRREIVSRGRGVLPELGLPCFLQKYRRYRELYKRLLRKSKALIIPLNPRRVRQVFAMKPLLDIFSISQV
jgi:hypothetical protein